MAKTAKKERKTKETQIEVSITVPGTGKLSIDTGIPFFDHMLTAMLFHGKIDASISATGDIEVEPHHLIEDTGIVLGSAFKDIFLQDQGIKRFGDYRIPMDEALSEAIVDVSNRPYLVYKADYPQQYCGSLDISLFKEFFYAFSINSGITMHLNCCYGENSHHMIEALFKAFGKALSCAFQPASDKPASTKGVL